MYQNGENVKGKEIKKYKEKEEKRKEIKEKKKKKKRKKGKVIMFRTDVQGVKKAAYLVLEDGSYSQNGCLLNIAISNHSCTVDNV